MISFRSSLSLSLVALVAALAGCSGGSTVAGANTASNVAAVASPESNGQHGHHGFGMHHRGGPDGLIHAALREPINLTAAQRTTIEGLVKQDATPKPAFDASHAAKLAQAIRTNTVESVQAAPD